MEWKRVQKRKFSPLVRMRELGTMASMVYERQNSGSAGLLRESEGDSHDNTDGSRIKSPTSGRRKLVAGPLASTISNEALESLIALGNELRKVRRRLISEGYVIDGERIYKPDGKGIQN
jgi:hypothetical protein